MDRRLGFLTALMVAGTGCTAGPSTSPVGTAIYVHPVRLGGTGSMMFLPAPHAAALDSDEAVVRAALAHIAAPLQCVDPVLTGDPLRWLHGIRTGSTDPVPDDAPARSAMIEATMASWSRTQGGPIDSALAGRMVAAIDAIVAATPRRPSSDVALPPTWLAPQQRVGRAGECIRITLSRPARHGTLAFIGVSMVRGPLNGAGFLFALERAGGKWDTVARQHSWVS